MRGGLTVGAKGTASTRLWGGTMLASLRDVEERHTASVYDMSVEAEAERVSSWACRAPGSPVRALSTSPVPT